MGKVLRIFGVVALGCLGAFLLYVASWILYFANYSEGDVSDRGYHGLAWIIYIAAGLWVVFIGRWLIRIGAQEAASAEQAAPAPHEPEPK